MAVPLVGGLVNIYLWITFVFMHFTVQSQKETYVTIVLKCPQERNSLVDLIMFKRRWLNISILIL